MSDWIPRLIPEALRPDIVQRLAPRMKRLGYLGEWFRCAGHAPDVLMTFIDFTEALKDALPADLSETAILTIATRQRNDYERHQHERLAIRSGVSRDWIAAIEQLSPTAAPGLEPSQRAVQHYALAALDGDVQRIRAAFEALHEHCTPQQAIAVVMLVGRYWTHSLGVMTLNLQAPVPSIFDDGFGIPIHQETKRE